MSDLADCPTTAPLRRPVARCEKCGREFLWVNPTSDWVDHFLPANIAVKWSTYQPGDIPSCEGRLVPIDVSVLPVLSR